MCFPSVQLEKESAVDQSTGNLSVRCCLGSSSNLRSLVEEFYTRIFGSQSKLTVAGCNKIASQPASPSIFIN